MIPYLSLITSLLGDQQKNAAAANQNEANAYMGKPAGGAPAASPMSGISDLLGKMPGKGEAPAPHSGSDGLMDPWAKGGHTEPGADDMGGKPDEDEDDLMSV